MGIYHGPRVAVQLQVQLAVRIRMNTMARIWLWITVKGGVVVRIRVRVRVIIPPGSTQDSSWLYTGLPNITLSLTLIPRVGTR